MDVQFGEHVPSHRRDANRVTSEEARAYEIPTRQDGASIGLVGDPELAHQPAYLGHMVNDCATLISSDAGSLAQYALAAATIANAAHVHVEGCHMASIALRDIDEGEEITCSYGPRYWLSRVGCTVSEMERAELALGAELRRGGELSRTMLPLMARENRAIPSWILDCFERSRA
uniref:SET domain-containing protein n=1 Tax=Haptolina brevifila TaxID=156173 RepID=A0A7S2G8D0_9EUKA